MNEILNNFLLVGDKLNPEMSLSQPRFTCSTCRSLTKNKERIQKFKETENQRFFFQIELDKASFQHEMTSDNFKNTLKDLDDFNNNQKRV